MINQTTQVFKALSDANRLRILNMIVEKPLCVCEITDILELATSTVSKHLSILRDSGLIVDEKVGKWVNYRINSSIDDEFIQHLHFLLRNWLKDSKDIIRDKQRARVSDRNEICRRQ